MFIIQRNDGQFVAKPGGDHSYTKLLQKARLFETRDEANGDRCPENERVRSVRDVIESDGE